MKRNQIDAILVDQKKRRKKIIEYLFVIIITLFILVLFIIILLNKNKIHYVSYKEDSNVNYKVYLKDNTFFEEKYLDENKQYIANLIEKISVNFNYHLIVDEDDVNYKYVYYVEADVNVNDKNTNKSLYNFKEKLIDDKTRNSNSNKIVEIDEKLEIDYNKYNDLIKKFVEFYDLENSIATLDIRMFVSVLGDCEKVKDINRNSNFSITMPLTTKTMGIDIEKELINDEQEKIMICNKNDTSFYIYLALVCGLGLIVIYLIVKLIKYIIITRSAESIYQKELKKILNSYGSYIQKVNNLFDISKYQLLHIDSFTDMLEIRDTIGQPILMSQNSANTGVYFMIPSNTKILYVYSIKVSDIKKKMISNNNEKNKV